MLNSAKYLISGLFIFIFLILEKRILTEGEPGDENSEHRGQMGIHKNPRMAPSC